MSSLKMIYIVSTFYEEVYICKPMFSRESNSEKYLVCKNFKYDQSKDKDKLNEKIEKLEYILEGLSSNLYLQDIFPDYDLPIEYINIFKYINIEIANKQQIMINKIVTYIKENNYFGDKYHDYRNSQIEATNWWKKTFFTDKYEKTNLKNLKDIVDYNIHEETQFSKKLV